MKTITVHTSELTKLGDTDSPLVSYNDVLRFSNELVVFSTLTPDVIFHNTFCSSDYGLLASKSCDIRPNYWLCWLWNRSMGTEVCHVSQFCSESLHIHAHSRKDGNAYLSVNNSPTDRVKVELPEKATCYTMSADSIRSSDVVVNGQVMPVHGTEFPDIGSLIISTGDVELAPATVSFVVL